MIHFNIIKGEKKYLQYNKYTCINIICEYV